MPIALYGWDKELNSADLTNPTATGVTVRKASHTKQDEWVVKRGPACGARNLRITKEHLDVRAGFHQTKFGNHVQRHGDVGSNHLPGVGCILPIEFNQAIAC